MGCSSGDYRNELQAKNTNPRSAHLTSSSPTSLSAIPHSFASRQASAPAIIQARPRSLYTTPTYHVQPDDTLFQVLHNFCFLCLISNIYLNIGHHICMFDKTEVQRLEHLLE